MMNNFKDIKVAVTSTGTMPVWMLYRMKFIHLIFFQEINTQNL